MHTESLCPDVQGRVAIEPLGETEAVPVDPVRPVDDRFVEEAVAPLTDRDRDRVLNLLDNPPPANAALRRAWQRQRTRRD